MYLLPAYQYECNIIYGVSFCTKFAHEKLLCICLFIYLFYMINLLIHIVVPFILGVTFISETIVIISLNAY